MKLIDTHCHIDDHSFDVDRERVLSRCHELGVTRMVVPAVDAEGWEPLLQLCSSHDGLYPALGLHPVFFRRHTLEQLDLLADMVDLYPPVAIGEIGLDYYIDDPEPEHQELLFRRQLKIAQEHNLPVLIHCRKAHDRVLAMLHETPPCGGIVHAFNGSEQQARQYLDLGFKLGFGGMLTYERSTRLRKLACALPREALVLETDAPDMTVASHHGERNSPEYLPQCLEALAQVRGEDIEELATQTTLNALEVLRLD